MHILILLAIWELATGPTCTVPLSNVHTMVVYDLASGPANQVRHTPRKCCGCHHSTTGRKLLPQKKTELGVTGSFTQYSFVLELCRNVLGDWEGKRPEAEQDLCVPSIREATGVVGAPKSQGWTWSWSPQARAFLSILSAVGNSGTQH